MKMTVEIMGVLKYAVINNILMAGVLRYVLIMFVPRERMRSPQPTRNYSVEIPTWSTHTQRRRLSARRAARIAG